MKCIVVYNDGTTDIIDADKAEDLPDSITEKVIVNCIPII